MCTRKVQLTSGLGKRDLSGIRLTILMSSCFLIHWTAANFVTDEEEIQSLESSSKREAEWRTNPDVFPLRVIIINTAF